MLLIGIIEYKLTQNYLLLTQKKIHRKVDFL